MAHWNAKGVMPKALADAPQLPAGCKRLWEDFLELHGARRFGMEGPARLSFRDLKDWQDFNEVRLPAWQVSALFAADQAYFKARAAE